MNEILILGIFNNHKRVKWEEDLFKINIKAFLGDGARLMNFQYKSFKYNIEMKLQNVMKYDLFKILSWTLKNILKVSLML